MHARSTTFTGRPDLLEAGLAMVRDEALPAVEAMPGCVGSSVLADRGSGTCVVTTAWESVALLRTTAPLVAPLRARAQEAFGTRPEVRTWQVGLLHRAHSIPTGAWARVTWTRVRPDQLDDQREVFRSDVLPQIEELAGFCSASLLVDRHTGRAALSVVYDSRDALVEARAAALVLRTESMRRRPSELLAVAELEVVLARLRVAETV